MRFLSAQLDAYISNNLWYKNAKNSNKMAKILSTKLSRLNSIEITYPTESNEVFVKIPKSIQDHLSKKGYYAVPDETFDGSVRFVSACNPTEKDIYKLVNMAKDSDYFIDDIYLLEGVSLFSSHGSIEMESVHNKKCTLKKINGQNKIKFFSYKFV